MYHAGGATDILNESTLRWASDRNRSTEYLDALIKDADKQIEILNLDINDMVDVCNQMEKQIEEYGALKERFKTELKERRRIVVGLSSAAEYKPEGELWVGITEIDFESIKKALISWAEVNGKSGVGRTI